MSDEMLAWIQFAIDIEKAGREFYEECLKLAKEQRSEELFKFLIDEEKRHEKELTALLEKKSGGDRAKIKASLEKYNQMSLERPMFTKEDLAAIKDPEVLVMEMFNKSAEQERKGINLYLDLEQSQEDPEVKQFFHDLAKQELIHKKKIVNLGMSLFGMEEDEGPMTPEAIEKELSMQKVVIKEVPVKIEKCQFIPQDIIVNKGETVILKINADAPAGLRMINFGINEYISPGKEHVVKFLADTAGEFEYFSNVPCSLGNLKMRGKLIVKGENEPDEEL
ncbi:cupredoxin domain-containing protein [Candidatus Woesearchaeota archaeon]|nr:cupredoxin domain-containing protein [Candidatus Woesearchaeota archaeon]